ncbi:MAG TPA: hypothetical protein VGO62_21320 [Myxococcota bacterium]
MSRPVTRLRLILPSNAAPTIDALAARMADALSVHGVQVRQQVSGAPYDGAPRADVALWLPAESGGAQPLDARVAPARVHAAVVVEPGQHPKNLARYDAIVVPSDALRDAVRHHLKKSAARDVPVVVSKLPGSPLVARDAEKALRGVAGRPVVLVDVRASFESEIERFIVQLALLAQKAAIVLLAPHDDHARVRVRALCDRHGVDAWLTSGADGFAQSVGAADLVVGEPAWHELALAALSRTAVSLMHSGAGDAHALVDSLRAQHSLDDVTSTLQLAANLDRQLADLGGVAARGLSLREALFGTDRELLDVLAALEPLPQAGGLGWELVGPHAAPPPSVGAGVVDARDKNAAAEPSRGQSIEDALDALKQRIAKS